MKKLFDSNAQTASARIGSHAALLAAFALIDARAGAQTTVPQGPLPAPALGQPVAERPLLASPKLPEALRGRALTIDDVVAVALSTNRNLALQAEQYRLNQGETTTARAGLGPSLSVGYTYDAYNNAQVANFGGSPIVTQNQFQNDYTLSLSLPLDINGELRAAKDEAQFNEIAAKLDINRVRNETVLNAKSAFYDVLRAQAIVKVDEDALQNAVDRLADAQQRLDAGTVARFDVTTAKSDVATAEQTLIKDRSALGQKFASLNDVLGIDVDTPLQLTTRGAVQVPESANAPYVAPSLKPSKPPEDDLKSVVNGSVGDGGAAQAAAVKDFTVANPLPPNDAFAHLLGEAVRTRPEILREDASLAAARKGVTVARAGLRPSLSVGYNYSYAPNVGVLGQPRTGYGSLTLSLPLFDSGATHGRVTQARAQVATAETNRRGTIDSITLELREAYLNLQAAEASLKTSRQSLAQADEAYRLARLRYTTGITSQQGVSPIVELSNAQKTLSQAQSDYVNALYDYNNDRSTLDKAIGRYAYIPGPLGYAAPPPAKTVGSAQP